MRVLIFCGIVLDLLLLAAAMILSHAVGSPATAHWLLPVLLAAFVPYFLAVSRARHYNWRRIRLCVLFVALIGRFTLLSTPPILSNDIYRYMWEGKVQKAGFNPYRLEPDAYELNSLHDATWENVSHREVPSAYPPLLLTVFRLGACLRSPLLPFRVIFMMFDLATLWLLIQWSM